VEMKGTTVFPQASQMYATSLSDSVLGMVWVAAAVAVCLLLAAVEGALCASRELDMLFGVQADKT